MGWGFYLNSAVFMVLNWEDLYCLCLFSASIFQFSLPGWFLCPRVFCELHCRGLLGVAPPPTVHRTFAVGEDDDDDDVYSSHW